MVLGRLFLALVLSSILLSCGQKDEAELLTLENQIKIVHRVKYEVQPASWIEGKEIRFLVSVESMQNQDAIDIDFVNALLLTDEKDTPYEPSEWSLIEESEFGRTGTLTVPLSIRPKIINLTFYGLSKTSFSWTFPQEDE